MPQHITDDQSTLADSSKYLPELTLTKFHVVIGANKLRNYCLYEVGKGGLQDILVRCRHVKTFDIKPIDAMDNIATHHH